MCICCASVLALEKLAMRLRQSYLWGGRLRHAVRNERLWSQEIVCGKVASDLIPNFAITPEREFPTAVRDRAFRQIRNHNWKGTGKGGLF